MTLNRVWLLGHVATRVRPTPEGALFLLATLGVGRVGTSVERHLVKTTAPDAPQLETGALVLVEGMLTRDESRRRHLILARHVTWLVDPNPIDSGLPPKSTHASPVPHERLGHFRRVGVGSIRERLIWVRPTQVRQADPQDSAAPKQSSGRRAAKDGVESGTWKGR